jgi:hypothetical protein
MCFSQSKTDSELKELTPEELKTDRKSLEGPIKESVEREKKLEDLDEKKVKIKSAKVQSIDDLAKVSKGVLDNVVSANDVLSKFKREIIDRGDGEVDVTNYKAEKEDYLKLAGTLAQTTLEIATGTALLQTAQSDAEALKKNPLKAKDALPSVSFSSEVLKVCGEEVALQTKLVNNLIATLRSSGNL